MKALVMPALLLLTGGCADGGGANDAATADAASNVAVNQAAAPADQPDAVPLPVRDVAGEARVRTLLDRIYAPYASDDAPGRDIAGFMEPQLAAALTRSEQGINVDPFIDAQDYEPFRPTYRSIKVTGDRAEAVVRLNSFGERVITYRLARQPSGWKIADINTPNGGSLRGAYGLPPLD